MPDILELSFEINTTFGIMACMPTTWWDVEDNDITTIERAAGVTVRLKGDKNTILQWLFNLGKDGRYKIILPPKI